MLSNAMNKPKSIVELVETKFLELAMSLLDFSPRIPIGTFSILLGCMCPRGLSGPPAVTLTK